jgi:hypothetical protein
MNDTTGLADLTDEIRQTRETIAKADDDRRKILTDIKAEQTSLRCSLDELYKRAGRLGLGGFSEDAERKAAIGLLELKHALKIPKRDAQHPFVASEDQIAEAKTHIDAIRALMHTTDIGSLPDIQRKALSAFSFGSNGFILPPTMMKLQRKIEQLEIAAHVNDWLSSPGPTAALRGARPTSGVDQHAACAASSALGQRRTPRPFLGLLSFLFRRHAPPESIKDDAIEESVRPHNATILHLQKPCICIGVSLTIACLAASVEERDHRITLGVKMPHGRHEARVHSSVERANHLAHKRFAALIRFCRNRIPGDSPDSVFGKKIVRTAGSVSPSLKTARDNGPIVLLLR